MTTQFYKILHARITYEVLRTEVIVIDFETGNYYTLIHVAKAVWQFIEQGIPLEQIAQFISDHYQRELGAVLVDLQRFIRELVEEGLIEATTSPVVTEATPISFPEGIYDLPQLQRYTDVQSLLLLDPIHEVTEVGWPDKLG